jgi:hypothetical protein
MCHITGLTKQQIEFYKQYNEHVLSVDKQESDILKRNKAIWPPQDWWVRACSTNPSKDPEDV